MFLSSTTFMVATVTTLREPPADTPRRIVDEPLLVGGAEAIRAYDVGPDGRILAIEEDDSVRSDHRGCCAVLFVRICWIEGFRSGLNR